MFRLGVDLGFALPRSNYQGSGILDRFLVPNELLSKRLVYSRVICYCISATCYQRKRLEPGVDLLIGEFWLGCKEEKVTEFFFS